MLNTLLAKICCLSHSAFEHIAQWGRAIWARCWLGHSACNTSTALWGELVSWATLPVFTPDLWVRPLCIFALQILYIDNIFSYHFELQRSIRSEFFFWGNFIYYMFLQYLCLENTFASNWEQMAHIKEILSVLCGVENAWMLEKIFLFEYERNVFVFCNVY